MITSGFFRQLFLPLLLVFVCPIFPSSSAKAFLIPRHEALPRKNPQQQRRVARHPTNDFPKYIPKIRGGADALAAHVPPLMTTALAAKTFSALFTLKGVAKIIQPKATLVEKGASQPKKDEQPLNTWFVRGIGAFSLGTAIHIYTSMVLNRMEAVKMVLSPLQIMGLALLPRGLFFVATVLSGGIETFGLNGRFFLINTVATVWCSLSLILGLGNPTQTAKVFSCMSFLKSCLFFFHPAKGLEVLFSKGKEQATDRSVALARDVGLELLTSSFLLLATAWGSHLVTPKVAAGCLCVGWLLLLLFQCICKTRASAEPWVALSNSQTTDIALAGLFSGWFFLGK